MANENGFRGKLFGGFNRKDVTDYIEKLAAERNHFRAEAEQRRNEAFTRAAQNDDLSARLAEAQQIASQTKAKVEEALAQAKANLERAVKAEESANSTTQALEQLKTDSDNAAQTDAAAIKAAEEKCAAMQQRIAELEAQLQQREEKLKEAEGRVAAAEARAREAEDIAANCRLTAMEEARQTMRDLAVGCREAIAETEAATDRANGEFWKVTSAMETLSASIRNAAEQFDGIYDKLNAEQE